MIAIASPRGSSAKTAKSGNTPLPATRFTESPEFPTLELKTLLSEAPATLYRDSDSETDRLLTPEGERHLFRLMNFHRYQANALSQKSPAKASPAIQQQRATQYRQHLESANQAREILVECNLRLVMGLAHQFSNRLVTFDELVSEGHLILLSTVDLFNYSKNYRFSTYATHSIQRHFVRVLQRAKRRTQRESSTPDQVLSNQSRKMDQNIPYDVMVAEVLKRHFDDHLNPREQSILRERFGLDGQDPATLNEIAQKIGVSKERVRQVQISALKKLMDLADRLQLSPELDWQTQMTGVSQVL